ncbi:MULTISPECIES: cytochrome ubiquinol oxidase subunit I [unclassified Methylobacterium]|uniref:cytochrome ubiquinol oxidase subunit I n=1 Tax=unclassified Methylobacterium TaxID=2615210 RepID=UPI0004758310|nr:MULTISPECIES: cytochrome ubiquinol oxidase subunit I [Methylobacterium]WFT83509.1 cytochrome ubiquinol oxidase subunit I [Methylobacterium nodulans]
MNFDALVLSRIQFAFTISFHIIFPAFTIGLASWLARLEFEWLRTGNPQYKNLYKFWVKVFAVSFGLGVVSGIVMSYQLGTNWSRYSEFTGNILGPLIAYEVITAFCLEAGFLGIMLFGWDRVGDRLHFFATCMVALGTLISAFWILSANSWMQTPDGFRVENGLALPVDWWKIIFNPSFPLRYAHMVMGCYLTTAFAVAGMSAWMLLRHPHDAPEAKLAGARRALSMALWFATIVTPIQIFVGDMHGLGVLKYQPTKLAAIEGNWERRANMPLRLFAIPDQNAETNHYEISIPKIGSYILTHEFGGEVPGLKDVPPDQRPPVLPVFFVFRGMLAIGFAMLGLSLWHLYLRWKGGLFTDRLFLNAAMMMTPSGFGAVLLGWFTAEIGRQPYLVYGQLRTADAVSPVTTGAVTISLMTFLIVYSIVFGCGSYYLAKLLRKGPDPVEEIPGAESLAKKPKRPLSLPDERLDGGPRRKAPQPAE